jgi:hypothetical protein
MVYRLRFFCRAGEIGAEEAVARLLDELLVTGDPLLGEWSGPFGDSVAACSLATRGPDGTARADWLTIEVHVGVDQIANTVIHADPDCDKGVWGCDLLAEISLSGDNPDWELVNRIWSAAASRWSAVAWDEMSGFDIQSSAPETG